MPFSCSPLGRALLRVLVELAERPVDATGGVHRTVTVAAGAKAWVRCSSSSVVGTISGNPGRKMVTKVFRLIGKVTT
jgi:hypothetical protein